MSAGLFGLSIILLLVSFTLLWFAFTRVNSVMSTIPPYITITEIPRGMILVAWISVGIVILLFVVSTIYGEGESRKSRDLGGGLFGLSLILLLVSFAILWFAVAWFNSNVGRSALYHVDLLNQILVSWISVGIVILLFVVSTIYGGREPKTIL